MLEYFKNLFGGTKDEFYALIDSNAAQNKKTFIITANPETLMTGRKNEAFHKALLDPETIITPDGIGVVKGAKMVDVKVAERITGVEIVEHLLSEGSKKGSSVYFYGAKPGVLERFKAVLEEKYKCLKVLGMHDGYTENEETVFKKIAELKPDLVFVALGIPRQELAIYNNLKLFNKGIFIGCGGSVDVLSGTKKRAPKIFIKLNLEWLYRILREPKRLGRFYNSNVKFFSVLKKEIRAKKSV